VHGVVVAFTPFSRSRNAVSNGSMNCPEHSGAEGIDSGEAVFSMFFATGTNFFPPFFCEKKQTFK
jgi:hypothetical protein